jgi:hypothetical protein
MRKSISGYIVAVFGPLASNLLGHFMTNAPGWIFRLASWICIVAGILLILINDPAFSKLRDMRKHSVPSVITICFAIIVIGVSGWWFFVVQKPVSPSPPKVLQLLFQKDFPLASKLHHEFDFKIDKTGRICKVDAQEYLDFKEKSKFLGFYIPASLETIAICKTIADDHYKIMEVIERTNKKTGSSYMKDSATLLSDLVFTHLIYLYHEHYLSIKERAELEDYYKEKHLSVQFRGMEYAEVAGRGLRHKKK